MTSTFDFKKPIGNILPPVHAARTLVLCFDGTGNEVDPNKSNVLQLFTMLKKHDSNQQMVYYQSGIGTYTTGHIATPMYSKVSKTLDMMLGFSIGHHIMSGYEFVMQSYQKGDRICIFGFSRGSYTACALAAMLNKVGLLPAGHFMQIPLAYSMFAKSDKRSWSDASLFKQSLSSPVQIEFVGVWDTVGSIQSGLRCFTLGSNSAIKTFRHALALDERRVKFRPTLFQNLAALQQENACSHETTTDVLEVWFAGTHSDVGGGGVLNTVQHSLARIPLRWMVRQCFLANTGIMFYTDRLRQLGLDPNMLYPVVCPRPPPVPLSSLPNIQEDNEDSPEEELELEDAISPCRDELERERFWWILELLPTNTSVQMEDGSWSKKISMGGGRERIAPNQKTRGINVHRSVKTRMENGYRPRVKLEVEPTWVD